MQDTNNGFIDFALSVLPEDKYAVKPVEEEAKCLCPSKQKILDTSNAFKKRILATKQRKLARDRELYNTKRLDPAYMALKVARQQAYIKKIMADPVRCEEHREKERLRNKINNAKYRVVKANEKIYHQPKTLLEIRINYSVKNKMAYAKRKLQLLKDPVAYKKIADKRKAYYQNMKAKRMLDPVKHLEYKEELKKKVCAYHKKRDAYLRSVPELHKEFKKRESLLKIVAYHKAKLKRMQDPEALAKHKEFVKARNKKYSFIYKERTLTPEQKEDAKRKKKIYTENRRLKLMNDPVAYLENRERKRLEYVNRRGKKLKQKEAENAKLQSI